MERRAVAVSFAVASGAQRAGDAHGGRAGRRPDRAGGFADEAFTAYFVREENLDDPTVLASVATRAGLDGEQLLSLAATEPVKGRLRANTEELVARGGFGSPSMFVGDKLFFGNDQLPVAEQELRRVPLWKE